MKGKGRFNDKKQTQSCQNAMSLSLRGELVIGQDRRGEEGLETRKDGGEGSSAAASILSHCRRGEVTTLQ